MSLRLKLLYHKNAAWIWTHIGVVVMGVMLVILPKPWKVLTSYSGYTAVSFLIVLLSLNPLKKIYPKLMLVTYLNRYRREMGVAAFSFATLHFICFIMKRGGILNTLPYAIHPAIGPALLVAYPIFLLLAISSNQYSVKKLTFVKWKKLHRQVYIAEVAIILHMIMVGQKLWAAILFTPLIILQLSRKKLERNKLSTN